MLLLSDVEEAGDLVGEAAVHVVDEGIEDLGGAGDGENIVVGKDSRDEGGVAGGQHSFLAGATHLDTAVALEAHGDDEAIVFDEVAVHGTVDLHHTDIEVGGIDDLDGTVVGVDVFGAVVFLYMVVEGLGGEFGVELAGLAVHAGAVVVVDAVGDVAGLLDLSEEDTATDGMDTTGREVEDITGLDLMVGEHLGDSTVFYAFLVLIGGYGLLEAGIEVGAWVGLDDVPHLRLAHLAMDALGHLVVRVHLDAEVTLGIDELDEQGQLAVVFRIDLLAKDGLGSFVDDRDEVPTLPLTVADDAGAGGDGTDLPTLAYGLAGRGEPLIGSELGATPNDRMQIRLK